MPENKQELINQDFQIFRFSDFQIFGSSDNNDNGTTEKTEDRRQKKLIID